MPAAHPYHATRVLQQLTGRHLYGFLYSNIPVRVYSGRCLGAECPAASVLVAPSLGLLQLNVRAACWMVHKFARQKG